MKTTIAVILTLALVASGSRAVAAAPSAKLQRPNIVFFYADDLGYGDLACYGSDVARTPRLDQLAAEGTRFKQFYVSHCVCSPTRASAITGQFPGRHGIHGHIAHFASNKKRQMPDWLDVAAPSFPRALQAAGYRTAMIGKWHLGGGSGRTFTSADIRNPNVDPFARSEIVINHPDAPPVVDYGFDYARTMFGNSPTWKDARPWPEPHETYPYASKPWSTWSSRAIADDALRFLDGHLGADASGNATPFYLNVWFKDVHTILRPTGEMREPFRHLPEKQQIHYAMIRFMDEQIGRVLDALEVHGIRDNTIVIFSSDNGGIVANGASNGPLRGGKHTLYEGGIRVPFIVRWPDGGVPAGRVDETSVLNICDFIPTFAKLTGARMPAAYLSDGEDMIAALRGEPFKRRQPQFWQYQVKKPSLAARIGDWKLLLDPDGGNAQLYDLSADAAESQDLSNRHPDVVESLRGAILSWRGELRILPAGN